MIGLYNGATLITKWTNITPIQSQQRNVMQLLNGTYYTQNIGEAARSYRIIATMSQEGLDALFEADRNGALLSVYSNRIPSFSGRILSMDAPEKVALMYRVNLILSEEALIP